MTITREQAHSIAEGRINSQNTALINSSYFAFIKANFYEGVSGVYDLDEITSRKPDISNWLMGGPSVEDLAQSWIAYINLNGVYNPGYHSSHIIVISKDTGEILYEGTANDEG
jgi:hypothetical protein